MLNTGQKMNHTELSSFAIEQEINTFEKPDAYHGKNYNLNDLENDRAFEILLYQLFDARIKDKKDKIRTIYDKISLMQGVGEKGRDCCLLRSNQNTGLIQCKKVNKNFGIGLVAEEITKFCLYYIIDNELIPDLNDFTYYFVVSTGFTGEAIKSIDNRKLHTYSGLEKAIKKNINHYQSLSHLEYDTVKNKISEILQTIKIERITPEEHIYKWLDRYPEITGLFYKILTVTDNTLLEGIIETYLKPLLANVTKGAENDNVDFTLRFKEYLQRAYNYYSSAKTLVFGNQQKKLADFYYPLTLLLSDEQKVKPQQYKIKDYNSSFIQKYKKLLIVDIGGMGKSTIMKWLFISAIKQNKGIPVFIELRKLRKDHTVIDEIVTQLSPIDCNIDRTLIKKLIAKGSFIFFLDGYDELIEGQKQNITTDLQNFITKAARNLFLLTSRPDQVLTTFSDFQEFNIKELEQNEAFELIKKLGNNNEKSRRLIKNIKDNYLEEIREFLTNPLLVSLLYKKFEYRETIPLKKQEFYYEVFEALFQAHDLTKGDSYIRPKKSGLCFNDFFLALRYLGFIALQKNELEYNQSQLEKYINQVKERYSQLTFNTMNFIEDLICTVPLFQKDGLIYRWAHKSIQQYFAAEFICRDTKAEQVEILKNMYKSERVQSYFNILDLCCNIDFKSFEKAVLYSVYKEYINYCDNSYQEILKQGDIPLEKIRKRQQVAFNKTIYVFNKQGRDDISSKLNSVKLFDGLHRSSSSYSILIFGTSFSIMHFIDKTKQKTTVYSHFRLQSIFKTIHQLFLHSNGNENIFELNDNINSPLNDSKVFDIITDCIIDMKNSFIEYEECKKRIARIEKEMKQEKENPLMEGL